MKLFLPSLLIGALALLSAPASAQRSRGGPSYSGVSASVHSSAYGSYTRSYSSSRVWVPGHYESVSRQVFVPGPTRRVWVEPVHEWRLGALGFRYVCIRAGYWKTIQLPGRYETRCERVYVPGHWVARGSCN